VQGKTASEAWSNAESQAKTLHKGGKVGETGWVYDTNVGTSWSAPAKGADGNYTTDIKTTSVDVTVTITVDTPKWEGYDKATPEEQKKWDDSLTQLKDHEEGHVEIATAGGTPVGNAVLGATATGSGKTPQQSIEDAKKNLLSAQTVNYDKARAEVQKQSDTYDQRTQHGKIPRDK
jgi:predicted secreted Zn-dependent protease